MTASPYENVYPKQKSSSMTTILPADQNEGCSMLSKCCFCIPLKTGCFILGYISLALNFLITLFFLGTLAFLAVFTHGFRYVHVRINEDGSRIPDEESIDKHRLNLTVTVIILVGCLNIAWFLMNIILLVGLHRKRPGHIKLHVTVATIRLLLSVIGIFMYGAHTTNSFIVCCCEIGLSAYFILLYYAYAVQLEKEQNLGEGRAVSDVVADVVFTYPQNTDKLTLTEKDEDFVKTII